MKEELKIKLSKVIYRAYENGEFTDEEMLEMLKMLETYN